MLLLLLCIFCNVLFAIIFKGFASKGVDNLNAIIVNYFVCVVVASLFLGESAVPLDLISKPWFIWSIILSILFIGGFNIMALSFQKSGVALTVIIQKMSLVMPAAFAIALYGETLNLMKVLGICAALFAIVLVNRPTDNSISKLSIKDPILLLPLLTLVVSGIIEIILYYVQVEQFVTDDTVHFTATSFGFAGLFGLFYSLYRQIKTGIRIGLKEVIGGVVLGVPNFFSIYLLVYLLSQGWQGSVLFPVNSVSILVLTAIVGFILFKETPDRFKLMGMALGVLAIVLISIA